MESPESSTERPPFDPSRLHYQSWGSYVKTWVFQFTIRSFVVWISVICLVLGNIVTGAMLLRSQQELKRAERETGFLVYDDATKIHVTHVPMPARGVWQFRVHLPEGQKYRLLHCVNAIPEEGYPKNGPQSIFSKPLDAGEYTFSYSLSEGLDGKWRIDFSYTRRFEQKSAWGSGSQSGLPDCEWIYAKHYYQLCRVLEIDENVQAGTPHRYFVFDQQGVAPSTVIGHATSSADRPVDLLRLRYVEVDGPLPRPWSTSYDEYIAVEKSAVFPAESDGIMFWIEPVTASQSDGTRQANN